MYTGPLRAASVVGVIVILAACGGGGGGGTNSGGGTGDASAPTTPSALNAVATSADRIDLTWNASTDNVGVAGYKLYRDGAYWKSVSGTSASDTGLAINTTHCYTVSAYDAAALESAQSSSDCATTLDTWTSRLFGAEMGLKAISWTGSQYLVVGNNIMVLSSSDGLQWSVGTTGSFGPLSLDDVVWAGTQYVALNTYGNIYTSPDGARWNDRFANSGGRAIAWSGSLLVAVGDFGKIHTSPDGITWTPRTSGTTVQLADVAWLNNTFVAVGESGTILTSPDGISWTPRVSGVTGSLTGVAWSGSAYVVVAASAALRSTDGIDWFPQTVPGGLYGHVAWSSALSLFVAVGANGLISTSPDGTIWTERKRGQFPDLTDIVWDGAKFVAVGSGGEIVVSSNGTQWNTVSTGSDLENVTWTGSKFVAVGGFGKVWSSTDGISWTCEVTGNNSLDFLRDVASSPGGYMVGGQTYFHSSADGVNWTRTSLGGFLDGVIWSGTQFVGVGNHGLSTSTIVTSPDGINITLRTEPANKDLFDLVWTGAQHVAVGADGTVITSPDAITWTSRTSGTISHLYGVAWSGSLLRLVAVGASGTILSSEDGITWTPRTSGTVYNLNEITWTGSEFIAVGNSSTILTSTDSVTWNPSPTPVSYGDLKGIASSGSRHVAVGRDNRIITLH